MCAATPSGSSNPWRSSRCSKRALEPLAEAEVARKRHSPFGGACPPDTHAREFRNARSARRISIAPRPTPLYRSTPTVSLRLAPFLNKDKWRTSTWQPRCPAVVVHEAATLFEALFLLQIHGDLPHQVSTSPAGAHGTKYFALGGRAGSARPHRRDWLRSAPYVRSESFFPVGVVVFTVDTSP